MWFFLNIGNLKAQGQLPALFLTTLLGIGRGWMQKERTHCTLMLYWLLRTGRRWQSSYQQKQYWPFRHDNCRVRTKCVVKNGWNLVNAFFEKICVVPSALQDYITLTWQAVDENNIISPQLIYCSIFPESPKMAVKHKYLFNFYQTYGG